MCELLGLSSNKAVGVSFIWRGFRKRGRGQPHGWGVAWYLNGGFAGLVKEPRPAPDSPIAGLLAKGVRSKIVISHVRTASTGMLSFVNTHPFVRRLWGRDWVFAHNGDVSVIKYDPYFELRWCRPAGETDSEYAFCHILEELSSLGRKGLVGIATRLWKLARKIGSFGMFNFLLSNGAYLFAFMNRCKRLHYLLRHPPHRGIARLKDEDFVVLLKELKAPDEYAAIIANNSLTKMEKWETMKPNTLYVFSNGDLLMTVYETPELVLNDMEKRVLAVVRSSPHCVGIDEIRGRLNLPAAATGRALEKLRIKGLVVEHIKERYCTNPEFREIIDRTLS